MGGVQSMLIGNLSTDPAGYHSLLRQARGRVAPLGRREPDAAWAATRSHTQQSLKACEVASFALGLNPYLIKNTKHKVAALEARRAAPTTNSSSQRQWPSQPLPLDLHLDLLSARSQLGSTTLLTSSLWTTVNDASEHLAPFDALPIISQNDSYLFYPETEQPQRRMVDEDPAPAGGSDTTEASRNPLTSALVVNSVNTEGYNRGGATVWNHIDNSERYWIDIQRLIAAFESMGPLKSQPSVVGISWSFTTIVVGSRAHHALTIEFTVHGIVKTPPQLQEVVMIKNKAASSSATESSGFKVEAETEQPQRRVVDAEPAPGGTNTASSSASGGATVRPLKQKNGAAPPPAPLPPPAQHLNKPKKKAAPLPPPLSLVRNRAGKQLSPSSASARPPQQDEGAGSSEAPSSMPHRVKSVHSDRCNRGAEVWAHTKDPKCCVDMASLLDSFQQVTATGTKHPSEAGVNKPAAISFLERRRAHTLTIEVTVLTKGTKKTPAEFKEMLETMDLDALSAEDVACLSKALIPTDKERRELGAYLNGTHPSHRGEKSLEKLAFVDQLFAAVLSLPRLEPRLKALAFSKSFHADVAKAAAQLEILEAAIVELRTSEGFTQLLGTALDVINGLNAHNSKLDGQQPRDLPGLKLQGLLQLPLIQDKTRSSSLLDFVIQQLAQSTGSSLQDLLEKQMLSTTRPAAALQVPAIRKMVESLSVGMNLVTEEIDHASREGCNPPKATENVKKALAQFAASAEEEMAALREKASQVERDLKALAAYFGEDFEEQAPTALIATAAELSEAWDKALKEMVSKEATKKAPPSVAIKSRCHLGREGAVPAAASTAAATGCVALTEADSAAPGCQGAAAKEE